ncbi:DUF254-domain-containing protein, partial [Rhodotorula sp. JG-1b]
YLPRRYFILSTAGKLVYTSDTSEEAATGLVGVMQAIISIFADEGDKIRYIDVGQTKISFLLKAPLYLVVVSSQGEPETVLRQHLDYLYLQVLSVVTVSQLQNIFAKRSNFDLRQLISGTEPFFDSLVSTLQTSLAVALSSISVYRLPPTLRSDLARALDPGKETIRSLDLLYVLLLAEGRLVTLLRPKKHSIHPTDLHLLLETVRRPSPLLEPGAESWFPICLPRFNPRGFLHAYVSFLETSPTSPPHSLSASSSGSNESKAGGGGGGGAKAEDGIGVVILTDGGLVHSILMSRAHQSYSLGELAIPGLRHFVYKDRERVQVTTPRWEGELMTLYQRLHAALHPRTNASGGGGASVQYLRTSHEAVLGWMTNDFELYVSTSPLLPPAAMVKCARRVSEWVKRDEARLFLSGKGAGVF